MTRRRCSTVAYDGYDTFDEQFGHLFFAEPFSHYRLRIEYRFVGAQAPDAPAWAARNSGVMVHSQPPETMLRDQDFPISIEVQFLGGLGDGKPRPTGNLCSPGTRVVYDGAARRDALHSVVGADDRRRRSGSRPTCSCSATSASSTTSTACPSSSTASITLRRRQRQRPRPRSEARRASRSARLHRAAEREPSDPVPARRAAEPRGLARRAAMMRACVMHDMRWTALAAARGRRSARRPPSRRATSSTPRIRRSRSSSSTSATRRRSASSCARAAATRSTTRPARCRRCASSSRRTASTRITRRAIGT